MIPPRSPRRLPVRALSALLMAAVLPASALAADGDAAAALRPVAPLDASPGSSKIHSYTVGPGDTLKVRVYEESRLDGDYLIAEDGRLDLPWVGKVTVDGLSPDKVADLLERRYADGYLVSPQIAVEVAEYGSKPVQLIGNIKRPGTYFLQGRTDLIGLLAEAGGVAEDDQLATYEVEIKRARTGEVTPITVSLDRLMHQGEGNLTIESGDVINITRGRVVFVSGEVTRPGPVAWREGLTITQVLAAAGGPERTANLRKALILRGDQRIQVNVRDIRKGRAPDVPIRADDQIIVDESAF